MIQISYRRAGDRHQLTVEGHAGQDRRGRDIVCAGVSALSFALLGYLAECGAEIEEMSGGSGSIAVSCTGDERAAAAFGVAMTGYAQIAERYPQYVEIHIAPQGGWLTGTDRGKGAWRPCETNF